ncbi:hypothetical protein M0657_007626 [Pyricularia oryzae]|nr:hypothetical protein M9X92_007884 [Pyricularia oryzae]KAI7918361.1 hypothetical protein M0657_007626 [Pyricularia oryzae]
MGSHYRSWVECGVFGRDANADGGSQVQVGKSQSGLQPGPGQHDGGGACEVLSMAEVEWGGGSRGSGTAG